MFVWPWINSETYLCETYVILGRFLHKNDPIYQKCSKMSIRHHKCSWWNHEYVILLLVFMLLISNANYSISLKIQDFGGRGNLSVHWKLWKLRMICLSNNEICIRKKEESMGQFSTKFHDSRWNIFLVMDEHRNGPLRNGGSFRPVFSIKTAIFYKICPRMCLSVIGLW